MQLREAKQGKDKEVGGSGGGKQKRGEWEVI